MPTMHLDVAALDHNIGLFHGWVADQGAQLAPHIKTTMCAPIVRRQVDAGVRGVTVATAQQAEIAFGWGVRELWIINELADHDSMARVRDLAERGATIRTLTDSVEQLALLERGLAGSGVGVLLEVGTPGGRTGVRTDDEAAQLLAAVRHSKLPFVGVSAYEGVVPNERDAANLARIDEHIARAARLFEHAQADATEPLVFTAGGSAFPDLVRAGVPTDAELVLRSGCYVTHDHGTYDHVTPLPGLRPACWVEATIISRPEPGLAVINAGKRELPHDAGLPVVLSHQGRVDHLFDHHAVVTVASDARWPIGDTVRLGISHPCSLFSRWTRFSAHHGEKVETWEVSLGR